MRLLPTVRNFGARQSSNHSRPTHRLAMEPLEDRLCLSYSTIDLGTLGGTFSNATAVNASGRSSACPTPPPPGITTPFSGRTVS